MLRYETLKYGKKKVQIERCETMELPSDGAPTKIVVSKI